MSVTNIALHKHHSRVNFTAGPSLAVKMDDEMQDKPTRAAQRVAATAQLRKLAEILSVPVEEEEASNVPE